MANPAFLRYLPARLKPLSSPAVWAPLTVFALASIFMWEYHQNPDWFDRPQAGTISPESELTPEEQARLSEVDTIDVLLKGLNDSAPNNPKDSADNSLINQTPSAEEGATPSRELSGRESPFAAYEEQYKFPNSNGSLPSAASATGSTQSPAASGKFDFGSGASLPSSGALSEALGRQQTNRAAAERAGQDAAEENSNSSNSSNNREAAASSTFRPSAQPANGGSSGGISAPFIRTTTNMSPPAGTTGYKAPSSSSLPVFNAAPPQPSRSPYTNRSANIQQNSVQPAAQSATPAASSRPSAASESRLYTAPSFSQPEQNRRGQ